jgi:hypothetical protein
MQALRCYQPTTREHVTPRARRGSIRAALQLLVHVSHVQRDVSRGFLHLLPEDAAQAITPPNRALAPVASPSSAILTFKYRCLFLQMITWHYEILKANV